MTSFNDFFQQTYTVRREVYHYRENKSVYFTMAFAGIAIVGSIVIGLVVLRRRANSPRNQVWRCHDYYFFKWITKA